MFQQILKAECKFDPRVWSRISVEARSFIESLLVADPRKRMTAKDALDHPWISGPLTVAAPKEPVSPRRGSMMAANKKTLKSPR